MIRLEVWEELEVLVQGLYLEMVEAHLAADPTADRRFMQVTGGLTVADGLSFRANRDRSWSNLPSGALDELCRLRLVTVDGRASGVRFFRISGESLKFHEALVATRGEAEDQLAEELKQSVFSGDFARQHPNASSHLREAARLVSTGELSQSVAASIGHELRQAIFEFGSDYSHLEATRGSEEPIDRLRQIVARLELSRQERAVLDSYVELARSAYRLDERLVHIRKETERGDSLRGWAEIHRAARATTFVLVELGSLLDHDL